jgi:hypothetical protein
MWLSDEAAESREEASKAARCERENGARAWCTFESARLEREGDSRASCTVGSARIEREGVSRASCTFGASGHERELGSRASCTFGSARNERDCDVCASGTSASGTTVAVVAVDDRRLPCERWKTDLRNCQLDCVRAAAVGDDVTTFFVFRDLTGVGGTAAAGPRERVCFATGLSSSPSIGDDDVAPRVLTTTSGSRNHGGDSRFPARTAAKRPSTDQMSSGSSHTLSRR